MNLNRALGRIGIGAMRKPTLQTLNELSEAFLSHVPFETLDLVGRVEKVWHLPTIYEKIVEKKRGGFCYELNGLLQWILKELGFKVELMKGFKCARGEFPDASDHMMLMVGLENGEKFIADVGLGTNCFLHPLRMELNTEQCQPNGIYRLLQSGNYYVVEKKQQKLLEAKDNESSTSKEEPASVNKMDEFLEDWDKICRFLTTAYQLGDFQKDFDNVQYGHRFLRQNTVVVSQSRQGRKRLFNDSFNRNEYINPQLVKTVQSMILTKEETKVILEKEFGIVIDFELNAISERPSN